MALSKDDLDALDLAIASGEMSVSVNGRAITYQSMDGLLRARRHVASVLSRQQQSGRRKSKLGSHFRTTLDRGV